MVLDGVFAVSCGDISESGFETDFFPFGVDRHVGRVEEDTQRCGQAFEAAVRGDFPPMPVSLAVEQPPADAGMAAVVSGHVSEVVKPSA